MNDNTLQFKSDASQTPANPFAAGAPVTQTPANPFAAGAHVTQTPANPFAAGAPVTQVAENPVNAMVQPETVAPAVMQPETAAPPNPFTAALGVSQAAQVQAIQQDVAAASPADPAPVFVQQPDPVQPVQDAIVIEENTIVRETLTPEVARVASVSGDWVPFSIMIPASKLDKVLSAIGRAVK